MAVVSTQDFEKLGQFYLGRRYDATTQRTTDELLLYDSQDLMTHALCVGMTGSGKTGLCVSLIEEAAIDGVPVLVIDPKGDSATCCSRFRAARPRISSPGSTRARRRAPASTLDEFAAAAGRRSGRTAWPSGARTASGSRVSRAPRSSRSIRPAARRAAVVGAEVVRTAGSAAAGRLRAASATASRRRRRACSACSASRPIRCRSREHILLSTILDRAWHAGRGPRPRRARSSRSSRRRSTRVGVMDVEGVLPGEGPLCAGDGVQQPAGGAGVRAVDAGRSARRRAPAAHGRGQAAACRSSRSRT